jgi:hypothetical protein
VKLVLDEHLSPAIAGELRVRGHDVVAAVEAGLLGKPDADVMEWAVSQGRAVATANYADFRGLHEVHVSRAEPHFGVLYIPARFLLSRAGFGRLVREIGAFMDKNPSADALESGEYWLDD